MVLISSFFSRNDISKYYLPVIHSSACSMHKAPMSLNAEFLLGRIQRTLVRRLISWLNLSKLFVVLILFRCWSGNFKQVKASSPKVSNRSTASGYFSDRSLEIVWSHSNPVSLSSAKKISSKRFLTQALSLFLHFIQHVLFKVDLASLPLAAWKVFFSGFNQAGVGIAYDKTTASPCPFIGQSIQVMRHLLL